MGRRPGAHGLVTSSPAVLGGRHPLPVPAFGGPGAPPVTAGEVTQTFRSHSEETSAKAKRGKLLHNAHLSNRSSLSPLFEGLHEDMVLTKQEFCQLMARIMRGVE